MKIETPIIALILGAVLFSGLFTIFFSLADDNNINYDFTDYETQNGTNFKDAFDQVNATKSEMDDIIEDFEETTISDSGSLFPFLSLALQTGKQFFNSLTILKNTAGIAAELLGIPAVIVGALMSIVLIIMVISIVMLLLGRSY
jgi:predicted Zn-dependent peptidase